MDTHEERSLLERIALGVERAGLPQVEVDATERRLGLARFSRNVVDQHVDLEEARVVVRVADGDRVATAVGSRATADDVASLIREAAEALPHVPPLEGFAGFCPAMDVPETPPVPHATAEATAADRAELLAPWLAEAATRSMQLAGTLETRLERRAVVTTAGQRCEGQRGWSAVRFFALDPEGHSGFGHAVDVDLQALPAQQAARRAMDRCARAAEPRALPPSEYDVVLEPAAVAELLEWLAMTGFSAQQVLDGTSFLAGRQGAPLTSERVTLADDAPWAARAGFAFPFDHEGTPVRRVEVIAAGRGGEPLTDRRLAARMGTTSNGHAVYAEDEVTAGPLALRMEGGTASDEAVLGGLRRGLLVSRLHYVNGLLDTRRTLMTGTTRDGTYWVEDGEVRHAVHNLRFTDEVLAAFARAEAVGARLHAVPTWWQDGGVVHCPAIRIPRFRFTGGAQ